MFPKKCKITIFGDSIPKGIIYENKVLKKLPENAVKLIADYYGVEVDNLASFGQTMVRLSQKGVFEDYLKNLNKKDNNIAVISIGGNDSDYNWKEVASSPHTEHLPKTPPKEFCNLLDDIISKLKKKKVQVILTNIPPIDSKRYFDNVIAKIADKNKVMEFLKGDIENIYRHQEYYNLLITKCALKNGCLLLDIRQDFLWDTNCQDEFCEDGVHPNKSGHVRIANSIIKQINALA